MALLVDELGKLLKKAITKNDTIECEQFDHMLKRLCECAEELEKISAKTRKTEKNVRGESASEISCGSMPDSLDDSCACAETNRYDEKFLLKLWDRLRHSLKIEDPNDDVDLESFEIINHAMLESEKIDEDVSERIKERGQMIRSNEDEVCNNAGGYVYSVSDQSRIKRYLILGTAGGTFYCNEASFRYESLTFLCDIIREGKGPLLLTEVIKASLSGSTPKQEYLMFALALCARYRLLDISSKELGVDQYLSSNKGSLTEIGTKAFNNRQAASQAWCLSKISKHEMSSMKALSVPLHLWNLSKLELEYQALLQKIALYAVHLVCRIPTHLFMFVKYCKWISKASAVKSQSCGWGRALRATIKKWYYSRQPLELLMTVTKYQNREGYNHLDLFRLCHITPQLSYPSDHSYFHQHEAYDIVLNYIVENFKKTDGKEIAKKFKLDPEILKKREKRLERLKTRKLDEKVDSSHVEQFIKALRELKTTKDPVFAAELIEKFGFVREHIPMHLLNEKEVWRALLDKMPLTALIRNLNKLTILLIEKEENGHIERQIVEKILNQDAIRAARIHPLNILLAERTYSLGAGFRGSLKWCPNEKIVTALNEAFLLSFKNIIPTNKRFCIGIDVSGSMESFIKNSSLSCAYAATAMCMMLLHSEPEVQVMAFAEQFFEIKLDRKWLLNQVWNCVSEVREFGATDCALPMLWALEHEKMFDVFIVLTDNETWFGEVKPMDALRNYREKMHNPTARLIVIAFTASSFTICDPNDRYTLDICGFDPAIPEIISRFILGEI